MNCKLLTAFHIPPPLPPQIISVALPIYISCAYCCTQLKLRFLWWHDLTRGLIQDLCHCSCQVVYGLRRYRQYSIVRYAEYEYMYESLLHIYKMYICVNIRTMVRIFDSFYNVLAKCHLDVPSTKAVTTSPPPSPHPLIFFLDSIIFRCIPIEHALNSVSHM